MKKSTLPLLTYVRSFVILGFSLYIAYLFKHDTLQYYLAPRLMGYLKAACIMLFMIGLSPYYIWFRSTRDSKGDCDCGCGSEHHHSGTTLKNSVTYCLLIIPLIFGFLLPDTAMNSALAAKRGMLLDISGSLTPIRNTAGIAPAAGNLTNMPAPPQSQEDYAKFAAKMLKQSTIRMIPEVFLEEMSAINLFPSRFAGKTEQITGFVYREPGMQQNQLVIARFALQCCSADATPYGVMIEDSHASRYAKDTWLTVTGTIGQTEYKGRKITQIHAVKIDKVAAPKSQYVYPDLDFLEVIF